MKPESYGRGRQDAVANIARKLGRLRKILRNWEKRSFGNLRKHREDHGLHTRTKSVGRERPLDTREAHEIEK